MTTIEQRQSSRIERDANLIAAAPQMLEALRLIANLNYKKAATNLSAFNAVNIAKKAIREATGEVVGTLRITGHERKTMSKKETDGRDFGSSDCSSVWRNLWLVFRFDGKENANRTLIDGVIGESESEALEEAKDRNPRKPDDIIVVKRCASELEYDWMREAWGNRNNAIEEMRKLIEG